jgi:hypothetical protein
MNVDWVQAGYLAGTIIRQGPVLIALLVGLVACLVARARLGAKAAWLGFAGFAIHKGYPGRGNPLLLRHRQIGRCGRSALGRSSAEFRHTWSIVIAGASGDGVGVNGPGAVRMSRRVIRRQMMP